MLDYSDHLCTVQQVQALQRKEVFLMHSPHLGLEYGNATLILLRQTESCYRVLLETTYLNNRPC